MGATGFAPGRPQRLEHLCYLDSKSGLRRAGNIENQRRSVTSRRVRRNARIVWETAPLDKNHARRKG